MTTRPESRLAIPERYKKERSVRILPPGPNDEWIEASFGTTRSLGSDREKASKGLAIDFFSDYEYGSYHLRQRDIEGRTCWTHKLVVIALEWLPKNRANMLCIDRSGTTYLDIRGYNYRAGKGQATVYEYREFLHFKNGYPPELHLVPNPMRPFLVAFDEDLSLALVRQALHIRGNLRIYKEPEPDDPDEMIIKANTPIAVVKMDN